jgi:galactoside O-acetyltransferase
VIEPGVRIIGDVHMGEDVSISAPAELMAKGSSIIIGKGCDIAAFVTITTADSHMRCIGKAEHIARRAIVIEDHVFIGTGVVVLPGAHIGHNSVIGANVVVSGYIPPWSRVRTAEPIIEGGFYERRR